MKQIAQFRSFINNVHILFMGLAKGRCQGTQKYKLHIEKTIF
jgi:hypothetical protein